MDIHAQPHLQMQISLVRYPNICRTDPDLSADASMPCLSICTHVLKCEREEKLDVRP